MSDYETTQRRRNMVVGVFVVVGICALVWLIFRFHDLPAWVSGWRSFGVFVQFPTAPGVQRDTPVRFCGYQIGRVTKVMSPEIRQDLITGLEYHHTVVILSIDKKYVNIPSNVDVKLMTRGLGSSWIELKVDPANLTPPPRDPNRPETRFLVDKMLLQGSTGMTSEFFPEESQEKLSKLVEGLETFVDNANDIIGNPSNKENLRETLANLTEASQEAKRTIEEFRRFAIAGTSTLKKADVKLEELVVAMVDTSGEISKATAQLRLILEKVNSGQGSAAELVNDGRLYENLLEDAQQLEVLLEGLTSLIDKIKEKGLRSVW